MQGIGSRATFSSSPTVREGMSKPCGGPFSRQTPSPLASRPRHAPLHALAFAAMAFLFAACSLDQPFVSPWADSEGVGGGDRIRAVTYNIHIGKGMDGRFDLPRIAQVITDNGAPPDVAALQEVDRNTTRAGGVDQFAELERLTGMKGVFGRSIPLQGGEYGIAILTTGEIIESRHELHPPGKEEERRSYLLAKIRPLNGRVFWAGCTHLGLEAGDRNRQVETILEISTTLDAPVLWMGDFNFEPSADKEGPYKTMGARYDDLWKKARKTELVPVEGYPNFAQWSGQTWPADFPTKRIDYLWASKKSGWGVRRAWVRGSLASDHLPLFADLTLR